MKTYKVRLKPTLEQREYFEKAFGIRRWTWNWAVAEFFKTAEEENIFLSGFELQKKLNNSLVQDEDYSWLKEVNSMARAEAFVDFDRARQKYAAARQEARRTAQDCALDKYKPKFKKKGKCPDSFRYNNKGDPWKYKSKHFFTLTRVRGKKPLVLRTIESIEFLQNARIATCTISREGKFYYAAITYEKTNRKPSAGVGAIGLDLGIRHPVAAHDGSKDYIFDLPESLKRAEAHTERVNRRFSRTQKGSKRHLELQRQLQEAYKREAFIKKDFREKLTHWLVSNYDTIKIDDFTFSSALNLRRTHRALYRVGICAFKASLKWKAEQRGVEIVIIPKGVPTTQTCSACGAMSSVKLVLGDREYVCEHCGSHLDRDVNSARNAYAYA